MINPGKIRSLVWASCVPNTITRHELYFRLILSSNTRLKQEEEKKNPKPKFPLKKPSSMAQLNPKALYVLAFAFSLLTEVCFIPVLSVFATNAAKKNTTFCWSWKIGTPRAENDDSCPFMVFFLAALVNGCLLLFTGVYFAVRLCLTSEYFQNPVCLKYLIKYSHFVFAMVTTLLSLVFLGLMLGFNSYGNGKDSEEYTGGLVADKHYYLVLVCVGVLLSFLSTVFSGIVCCKRSSPESDYAGGDLFNVFSDYSDDYEQIN